MHFMSYDKTEFKIFIKEKGYLCNSIKFLEGDKDESPEFTFYYVGST